MRVLVVGGYGVFGRRAAERMAADAALEVIVAGRSAAKAAAAAAELSLTSSRPVTHTLFDAARPDPDALRALRIGLVINASGPFQQQTDYALARAAIAAHSHYVDLSDARGFVAGVTALDSQAREAGVLVTSGASSVPAVAGAAVDHLQAVLGGEVIAVAHAISPGNSYDPGAATMESILQGVGRPVPVMIDGAPAERIGWMGLHVVEFPGLGRRLAADCDVPDLDLFPPRYPALRDLRFRAALELPVFQLGLWTLACLVRAGVVSRPERLAGGLTRAKRWFKAWGSDRGGMVVDVTTRATGGELARGRWSLVAGSGQGTYVPSLASVVIARKLAAGTLSARGAAPCLGFIDVRELQAAAAGLDIRMRTERRDQL